MSALIIIAGCWAVVAIVEAVRESRIRRAREERDKHKPKRPHVEAHDYLEV